ncbi:MAG: ATP-binding protein [Nitrospirota bacterium]
MSKLFKKTLLIMIILFAIIAMTTAISTGWNLYNDLIVEYKSKGTAIARSIASSSVETLLNREPSTVQAMIDQFTEILGVSYVFVVDNQGEIISHTFIPMIPHEVLLLKKAKTEETRDIRIEGKGDFIDISYPIVEGTVGVVHVGMDKGIIFSQLRAGMLRQLSLLSIIFIISVVFAYIFVNKISQPLNKLTDYSRKLASHDFTATVDIKSQDEVGMLADTMKSMAMDLSEVFERYELALKDAIVELQDTLAYLTAVIDNMADGLLVTDTDGIINHVNPALSLMFHMREADMIGKNCRDIFGVELAELVEQSRKHPDEAFTTEIKLAGGKFGQAVATGIHKDSLETEEMHGKGIGSVILIRDVTAEKEIDQMKTDFISTVSHELRTPLTSVLGFTEIIEKRLEENVFPLIKSADQGVSSIIKRIRNNIKIILSEGERLTALINDVLDISKLEAGKVEWKMEKIQVSDLIEHARFATSSLFEQKKLEFKQYIEPGLPEIMGDRDRLIQVLINLLSNAVKFTDTGHVFCQATNSGSEIVVSIADTGSGIGKEDLASVFEKFKQAGDTLTDKPRGTGLGLPICKQIIEYHGGRIWAESESARGSTFSFSLPIVSSPPVKGFPGTWEYENTKLHS